MIKKCSKVLLKTCIISFFSRLNYFYKFFYNNIHAKDGKIVQIIISQVARLSSIDKSVYIEKWGKNDSEIILNFLLFFITRKMKSKSEIPIWNELFQSFRIWIILYCFQNFANLHGLLSCKNLKFLHYFSAWAFSSTLFQIIFYRNLTAIRYLHLFLLKKCVCID